jgi:hypothetical protein
VSLAALTTGRLALAVRLTLATSRLSLTATRLTLATSRLSLAALAAGRLSLAAGRLTLATSRLSLAAGRLSLAAPTARLALAAALRILCGSVLGVVVPVGHRSTLTRDRRIPTDRSPFGFSTMPTCVTSYHVIVFTKW